jgi:secreted trypsin-like serine protease
MAYLLLLCTLLCLVSQEVIAQVTLPASCVTSAAPKSAFEQLISPKIVGGTETDVREFPFQVSLQTWQGFHYCGGLLIAPSYVLTAAHCGNINRVQIGYYPQSKCVFSVCYFFYS